MSIFSKLSAIIKQNTTNLFFLVIGIVIMAISAVFYFSTTAYTVKSYDRKLIPDRNRIIKTVDELTQCFASTTQDIDCEDKIEALETESTSFTTLIDQTKVPKNGNEIKNANITFNTKASAVAENATDFQNALTSDDKDIQTIISNYNNSVDALNAEVTNIKNLTK
jgi:hypothetical protein